MAIFGHNSKGFTLLFDQILNTLKIGLFWQKGKGLNLVFGQKCNTLTVGHLGHNDKGYPYFWSKI